MFHWQCWTHILERGLVLSSCSGCTFCQRHAQLPRINTAQCNYKCVWQKVQTEQLERTSPLSRMCVQHCQWNTTYLTILAPVAQISCSYNILQDKISEPTTNVNPLHNTLLSLQYLRLMLAKTTIAIQVIHTTKLIFTINCSYNCYVQRAGIHNRA